MGLSDSEDGLRSDAAVFGCVELVTPATDMRKLEKALGVGARRICIDLEDAVPDTEKDSARENAIRALRDFDWSGLRVAVRINGTDTPYFAEDIEALVGSASSALTAVLIPKATSASQVSGVIDRIIAVERRVARTRELEVDVLIENAAGLINVAEIVTASPRIRTVALGPGDLTMSLGSRTFGPGRADPVRLTRVLDYPRASILAAGRAAGVTVFDGPSLAPVMDLDFYEHDASSVSLMGFDGKWALHPAQIPRAQAAFEPTADELAWARETLELWDEAKARGVGALLDSGGRLIDAVPAAAAWRLLNRSHR